MARPFLATQYSARSGEANSTLIEEMVTTLRKRVEDVATMRCATAWVRKNGPRRLTPMRRS
ncbi:hypothetical protein D3C87_1873450 [compost metagenome]